MPSASVVLNQQNIVNVGGGMGGRASNAPANRAIDGAGGPNKDPVKAQHRFNFELLGTLFLGMSIQRTFKGMVDPVLKLVGFFELWNALFTMLLVPVLIPIVKLFAKMVKFVSNLSPNMKSFIGALIIGGVVLGSLLVGFSQVLLFVSGLGAALLGAVAVGGVLGLTFGGMITALTVVGIVLSGLIALIAALVVYLQVATGWARQLAEALLIALPGGSTFGYLSAYNNPESITGAGLRASMKGGGVGDIVLSVVQNNTGGYMPQSEYNRRQNSLIGDMTSALRGINLG